MFSLLLVLLYLWFEEVNTKVLSLKVFIPSHVILYLWFEEVNTNLLSLKVFILSLVLLYQ